MRQEENKNCSSKYLHILAVWLIPFPLRAFIVEKDLLWIPHDFIVPIFVICCCRFVFISLVFTCRIRFFSSAALCLFLYSVGCHLALYAIPRPCYVVTMSMFSLIHFTSMCLTSFVFLRSIDTHSASFMFNGFVT